MKQWHPTPSYQSSTYLMHIIPEDVPKTLFSSPLVLPVPDLVEVTSSFLLSLLLPCLMAPRSYAFPTGFLVRSHVVI
jgi:hypothetical protein